MDFPVSSGRDATARVVDQELHVDAGELGQRRVQSR
jgi:hypothetical protein